jgi:tetratricopeptide (TPR) repeat protein
MNDAMARHCEAETLAAFVEGNLIRQELAPVTEHLANCEECRSLAAAGAVFGREEGAGAAGAKRRQPLWWMVAAASVAILIGIGVPLRQRFSDPLRRLQPESHRSIQSRLTAFDYAPFRVTRGGESEQNWKAMAAAAELQEELQKKRTAENLHRYALAEIALGKTSEAVDLLTEASGTEPENAQILSDLAAAQCAIGKTADCAENAAKALRWEPSLAAAAFNRALALEMSSNTAAAIDAWQKYLKIEATSAWAVEAREHLAKLRALTRLDRLKAS